MSMKMEEDYTQLREGPATPGLQQEYYWILAVEPKTGRPIVLGAYSSEDEANRVGFAKIDGSFEVVKLKTRDSSRATKILKYRRFHQTAKLEEATKRAKHRTDSS